jgi:2-dehydro-3-deoxyphosphogluconate aldolase/(4S)-4-hydroxy-2-oxoglutarate aldolase
MRFVRATSFCLISHLVRYHPKMIVGAGTVLDTETARICVDAGARFLTAPGFDLKIEEFAAKENLAVLPGALTPTEVVTAWRSGADFVKVFPCAQVGGDKYIKALNTSLPQIPLIAAGGVNQQTAVNFILSGATALGIGTELIPTGAIERRQSGRIRELALRFTGFVKEARERIRKSKKAECCRPEIYGNREMRESITIKRLARRLCASLTRHRNVRGVLRAQKVYLCTSDQSAETGGERPHKMKSPQPPFLTTP